jgi:RNA 3'-terminal phosphate cyclase (ATP)
MITLDGSSGEGGGQILRTALGLSAATGQAFRIEQIRANREKPGLLRQHLTAVMAASEVCGAEVHGAELHSRALTFKPGKVRAGSYRFATGSAGSATLVFQTVLPALLTAGEASDLVLEGGTHNPLAPPFDFLAHAFLPLVKRIGSTIRTELHNPGFYPAGGGKCAVHIDPAPGALCGLELLTRGKIIGRRATAHIAGLPQNIGHRELFAIRTRLNWPQECFHVKVHEDRLGPGNAVCVELDADGPPATTEVFTAFGQRGVTAEAVAGQVLEEVERHLRHDVPVGEHLADQLMVPLALAAAIGGAQSRYRTYPLSGHAVTNIETIQRFLPVRIEVREQERTAEVHIRGQ